MEDMVSSLSLFLVVFFKMFSASAPFWLLGIAAGSMIRQVVTAEKVKNIRFLHGFSGIFSGAILGVISPVGLYGALPFTAALTSAGVPAATSLAFLISTPLINPNLFIFTAGVFGYPMAIARLASAVVLGIAGGSVLLILEKLRVESLIGRKSWNFECKTARGHHSKRGPSLVYSPIKGFIHDFLHFLRFSTPYFLIAIVVASLIGILVPHQIVKNLLGSANPFSVIIAAILSIPLYVCGGNTIPFVHELVEAGMDKGAALAFFIAGPATKISNVTFLSSILGVRGVTFFLIMTFSAAIAAGYWYGFVF